MCDFEVRSAFRSVIGERFYGFYRLERIFVSRQAKLNAPQS
jgi:hypothetical protein